MSTRNIGLTIRNSDIRSRPMKDVINRAKVLMRQGEVFLMDLSDLTGIPQPRLSEMFHDGWGNNFWKTLERLEKLEKVVETIELEIEERVV